MQTKIGAEVNAKLNATVRTRQERTEQQQQTGQTKQTVFRLIWHHVRCVAWGAGFCKQVIG